MMERPPAKSVDGSKAGRRRFLAGASPARMLNWAPGLNALALTVVFSYIYVVTRTAGYSVDAVRVADDITAFHRRHDVLALFHPGYLAFSALGMILWKSSELVGYRGGPLPVLGALNSIAGGVGVGMLSLLLRSILMRSRALTVLLPTALGFSFGYWLAATDGSPEMPAIAVSITTSYLLVRAMLVPNPLRSSAAGLACAFACILHVFAALMVLIGVVAIWNAEYTHGTAREEWRARLANIGFFIVSTIVPILCTYLFVGTAILRLEDSAAWWAWITRGFDRDWWFSSHFIANLRLDAYAFRKALFVEPGIKSGTFHVDEQGSDLDVGLYWAALIAWFAAVYAILSATTFLVRTHYRPFLLVTLAAGFAYAAVSSFVSPGNCVFWIPVVIASVIVTAISGSYYRGRRGGISWLFGIGCWTAIFAASNFVEFILPHVSASNNSLLEQARMIERHTRSHDILVVSGTGDDSSLVAYLPYFTDRTVFSLRESLQRHNDDEQETSDDLRGAVVHAIADGYHAYALGDIWQDPAVRARLRERYRVASTQALFVGLNRSPAWRDPDDPDMIVWKLVLPTDERGTGSANRHEIEP